MILMRALDIVGIALFNTHLPVLFKLSWVSFKLASVICLPPLAGRSAASFFGDRSACVGQNALPFDGPHAKKALERSSIILQIKMGVHRRLNSARKLRGKFRPVQNKTIL